jgi:hypothetical protein
MLPIIGIQKEDSEELSAWPQGPVDRIDIGVSPIRINGAKTGVLPDPVISAVVIGGKIKEVTR